MITHEEAEAMAALVTRWAPYARAVCKVLPVDREADEAVEALLSQPRPSSKRLLAKHGLGGVAP